MIEITNITKHFGNVEVLKGVSATIGAAEVVAIVGASGAGKTTLLQIIGTLDRPDSGKVIYEGVDVMALRETELARFRNRNIGAGALSSRHNRAGHDRAANDRPGDNSTRHDGAGDNRPSARPQLCRGKDG